MRKSVIYNLIGSIFDKGLPLIISMLLTRFMSTEDYGKWSLFYTFILVSYAFGASPILTFFSRNYYHQERGKEKMHLYFYKVAIVLQVLCIIAYYLFFAAFTANALLEIPTIICINLYSYLTLFYRFKGMDKVYMMEALKRFLFFAVLVVLIIVFFDRISYTLLIGIFILSHVLSIVKATRLLSFNQQTNRAELKEFFSLSAYGLTSSMLTGLDKFIIVGAGYGFSFLGYYSFIYTIANTPSIIVESFKKSVNPIMYKDLTEHNKLSSRTKRMIYALLVVLLGCQIILPHVAYSILDYFQLINKEFIHPDAYKHIAILSLGFFFVAIYQIISPYFFFYKKTMQLLIILLLSLLAYVLAAKYFLHAGTMHYEGFMWLKTSLLILITVLCVIVRVNKNNATIKGV